MESEVPHIEIRFDLAKSRVQVHRATGGRHEKSDGSKRLVAIRADDRQLSACANKEQIFGKIRRGKIQRQIKLVAGKRDMIVR